MLISTLERSSSITLEATMPLAQKQVKTEGGKEAFEYWEENKKVKVHLNTEQV